MARLTKKSPQLKLAKNDYVVVVAYLRTVTENDGRRGGETIIEKTTLYATAVEADARIVQRYSFKPPTSSDERVALMKAMRSGVTENLSDLSNAELHGIHAKYESELHGLNQPALTLSDVVDAGGGGTLPRVVVSKMHKVENGGLRITSKAVEVSITNKLDGTCDLAWQWDDGSQATDNWTNVEVELTFDITLAESETREGSLLELIVGADTPHALIVQQHCARTAGRAAEGGSMPVSDMLAIAKALFPAMLDERLGQRPSQKKKKDAAQYFLSLLNEELASAVRVKGEPFIIPADAAGSASAIAALVRSFNSKGSGLSAGPSPAAWPRCHAIWKRAVDQESFDVAVSECMAACLSGNMLDTVRRHSRSMLNELERKLTAVGTRGSAAAVEAYAGNGAVADDLMDAEAVIAMVFDMLAPQGTAGISDTQQSSVAPTVTLATPDLSGTQAEITERTTMKAVADHVAADSRLLQELDLIESTPREELGAAVRSASAPIQRLLLAGDQVDKALIGRANARVVDFVVSTRNALLKQYQRAFTNSRTEPEPLLAGALKTVLAGLLGALNPHHLLGQAGVGFTRSTPLKAFEGDSDANAKFAQFVTQLQKAWSLAMPEHTSQVICFCAALSEEVAIVRAKGGTWADLGKWYYAIFREVDRAAEQYLTERHAAVRRAPPDLEWITDRHSKYAIVLNQSVTETMGASSGRAAAEAAMQGGDPTLAAAIKKMDGLAKVVESLRLARSAPKLKGAPTPPAKRQLGREDEPPAKHKKEAPVAGVGEWDGRSKRAQIAHLNETVGKKDGKFPCLFHFTPGRTCRFPADQCKGHHSE